MTICRVPCTSLTIADSHLWPPRRCPARSCPLNPSLCEPGHAQYPTLKHLSANRRGNRVFPFQNWPVSSGASWSRLFGSCGCVPPHVNAEEFFQLFPSADHTFLPVEHSSGMGERPYNIVCVPLWRGGSPPRTFPHPGTRLSPLQLGTSALHFTSGFRGRAARFIFPPCPA